MSRRQEDDRYARFLEEIAAIEKPTTPQEIDSKHYASAMNPRVEGKTNISALINGPSVPS